MSEIRVKVGQQNIAKARVGQQNTIKVVSSISGAQSTLTAESVIGGIASVSQLNVSGISTFADDVYINGDFYYTQSEPYSLAYFDLNDKLVSTASTSLAINETNYVLTTNSSGVPTWASVIDGGSY